MRLIAHFFSRLLGWCTGAALCWGMAADQPFHLEMRDAETGAPVPLVEVTTTHSVRFVSDNAGNIAVDLPELMHQEIWFSLKAHGYSVEPDEIGYRGFRVLLVPGKKKVVMLNRQLPARRVGRLTGAGLLAESAKLGLYLDEPESGLVGCDSVQGAFYQGEMHWVWGDTLLARYPLGLFHVLSGTSAKQPWQEQAGVLRPRYTYWRDVDEVVRNTGEMPGDGPTWISGLVAVTDRHGVERLVGSYAKVKPPLTVYETGLCVWNDQAAKFDRLTVVWNQEEQGGSAPLVPEGHAVRWVDPEGSDWLLFGDPFPKMKCEATFEAWSDATQWRPLEPQAEVRVKQGGASVAPHRGSIAWSSFRQCWVAIFTQIGGDSSFLGEIWYAEAATPLGEWGEAVKVVTHDNYTFYNPRIHQQLLEEQPAQLWFEGTYTREFAKDAPPTPRYDYNQILYRLDLSDLE